jgi:nucleoside-diphosphate-sugar epimerase
MENQRLIAVVGADGFVGGGLAALLHAERIVYRSPRNGEIHISHGDEVIRRADVIVNAAGFRVRRGLTYRDYQRCHEGATAALVPWIRPDALFVHISSAHVLGKSTEQKLGNQATPNPTSYPSAAYALAKFEADKFLEQAAAERRFRVNYVRPTILYAHPGDTSLVDNLLQLAKRGISLRLYPRGARHHLCHLNLLAEVVRRLIEQNNVPHLSRLVVADPYTVTSRDLEEMIRRCVPGKTVTVPVPAPWMSTLLRRSFHSRNPRLDLATWGEIFGVLHLDTEYDSSETFRLLGIDPTNYSPDRTLLPVIRQALLS